MNDVRRQSEPTPGAPRQERENEGAGKRWLRQYFPATVLFLVLSAVAQSVVMLRVYDAQKGVYATGTPLGSLVGWGIFLFSLILIVWGFVLGKQKKGILAEMEVCSVPEAFFAAAGGVMMAAVAVASFLDILQSQRMSSGVMLLMLLLLILLSVFPAVYMILSAITHLRQNTLLIGTGFFPVLWAAVCLMRTYFDRTSAINDPLKIFTQVSLAAVMLYFLMELRIRVGKGHTGAYLAASSVASLLCLATSISVFAGQLLGDADLKAGIKNEGLTALALLVIGLYILSRLFFLSRRVPAGPSPVPEEEDDGEDGDGKSVENRSLPEEEASDSPVKPEKIASETSSDSAPEWWEDAFFEAERHSGKKD